ncbi:MAG: hypothetical protein JXA14_09105 [Anaerolineae bacterium]|nr:hypothetical protein [Anaerolineae bacterium]
MTPAPTVKQIVQKADADGLLEPALKRLPKNVTSVLRAMVAGERPATTLLPRELAKLGETVGKWDVPYGRSTLGWGMSSMMATAISQMAVIGQPPPEKAPPPEKPPKVSESLIEHLGLATDKAARVEAIVHWPIGFTRADLVQWGLLSEEESEAVWDHIVREYGLYTTGTLYAVP